MTKSKSEKIVSLGYREHSIFCHPTTKKEFQCLCTFMKTALENNDTAGVFMSAMQLIPDIIISDDE